MAMICLKLFISWKDEYMLFQDSFVSLKRHKIL